MILRRYVCFKAPKAPKVALKKDRKTRKPKFLVLSRILRGATFCQVLRTKQQGQETNLITWGNQKCKGATPAFRAAPTSTKKSLPNPTLATIIAEPSPWASKYLPAPLPLIKGSKESLFSSNASHIPIQFLEVITIKVETKITNPKRK